MSFEEEYDWESEEELENSMDEFIENLREDIENSESRTAILNPAKLKQIQFAYAALKHIAKGRDVKVSYTLNEPFKNMGSVSAEGRLLEFHSPEWFARVAEFADNTEVYPLAKNKVRLTFTFYGLTTPIE